MATAKPVKIHTLNAHIQASMTLRNKIPTANHELKGAIADNATCNRMSEIGCRQTRSYYISASLQEATKFQWLPYVLGFHELNVYPL